MADDAFADRKRLTFAQAEGAAPLPAQLALREISPEMRAMVWTVIHRAFQVSVMPNMGGGYVIDPWLAIMRDKHVLRDHRMVDDFGYSATELRQQLRAPIERGDYVAFYDLVQWLLRHRACPSDLHDGIDWALKKSRAAYRVFDRDTIVPIGSEAEAQTLERAFADLAAAEFHGARAHLRKAGEELTAGRSADSIRESIHAVESVARVLEPSAALAKALGRLEGSAGIHRGLKQGFQNIYGYTSDEKGIRHPMLDAGAPNVDKADALFMIGACASFVSYLINKARVAGLVKA